MSPKTTEEWEAEDLITDLKAGIPRPGEDRRAYGTCSHHDPMARGMIWIIRHLDAGQQEKDGGDSKKLLSISNGKFKVNFTGFGATEIALIVIVGIMAWNLYAVRRVRLDLDEKIPNVGRVHAANP